MDIKGKWMSEPEVQAYVSGLENKIKELEEKPIKELPAVQVEYEADGYDDEGNLIYDKAYCPCCRQEYEVDYDNHDNYCRNCGQKLNWEVYSTK